MFLRALCGYELRVALTRHHCFIPKWNEDEFSRLNSPSKALRRFSERNVYVQFKVAVPLTLVEVLLTPLLTVICRFCGAVAVTVTLPAAMQVALPVFPLMVATALFDVFQLRPSAAERSRLELLVKFPVAVNTTSWLRDALAVLGLTEMLEMLG